jgi:hypothetical protein
VTRKTGHPRASGDPAYEGRDLVSRAAGASIPLLTVAIRKTWVPACEGVIGEGGGSLTEATAARSAA